MIRLLYFSQTKNDISEDQIQNILTVARKRNAELGVTGVLLRGGGMFMQVLEGPEQAVLKLYVKILDDARHRDSRIVYITPVKDRLFGNWSMGFLNDNPLDVVTMAQLRGERSETIPAEQFSELIRNFGAKLIEQNAKA